MPSNCFCMPLSSCLRTVSKKLCFAFEGPLPSPSKGLCRQSSLAFAIEGRLPMKGLFHRIAFAFAIEVSWPTKGLWLRWQMQGHFEGKDPSMAKALRRQRPFQGKNLMKIKAKAVRNKGCRKSNILFSHNRSTLGTAWSEDVAAEKAMEHFEALYCMWSVGYKEKAIRGNIVRPRLSGNGKGPVKGKGKSLRWRKPFNGKCPLMEKSLRWQRPFDGKAKGTCMEGKSPSMANARAL